MTVEIVNFGCRLNSYEGEVMKQKAEEAGLNGAIIFNSCAVTAEAERQVRQAVRRARKENPDAKIIVTGCGAQINPQQYAAMPEVDSVIGNEEKVKAEVYSMLRSPLEGEPKSANKMKRDSVGGGVQSPHDSDCAGLSSSAPPQGGSGLGWNDEKIIVNDIMSVKETASHMVTSFDGRARAFVQVQNGCDHRCTFCIIPFGRGNSRSVAMGDIVAQVRALVEQGFNEVVLTGVDISDYGKDLPGAPTLGQMMRRLLALVPELKRLRLSSIDAVEVDDDLYCLIGDEPRLMPHLHVSLQAGDDMILKRMKRRHLRQDAIDFCARVRQMRPDVVFGADIITGFPTETEEMFQNTLNIVDEAGLTYLHVFPYSARVGTPAAKMPQVAKDIRKERAARLRAKGEVALAEYLKKQIGSTASVLVEKPRISRSEGFAMVELDRDCEAGSIVSAQIVGAENDKLIAKVAA